MNVAYVVCCIGGFFVLFVFLPIVQTPSWLRGLGIPQFGSLVFPVFSPSWTPK